MTRLHALYGPLGCLKRRNGKYAEVIADLRQSIATDQADAPNQDKHERKRLNSAEVRQCGAP